MPIRTKNLDLSTDGLKRVELTSLGDVTATVTKAIFVAPVACVVNSLDFYSRQSGLNSASNVSGINFLITVREYGNGSSVASRGNSATAVNSDTLSANQRYRLTPSSNNSLTNGAVLEVTWGITGTSVFSATVCLVTYTPLTHRESR